MLRAEAQNLPTAEGRNDISFWSTDAETDSVACSRAPRFLKRNGYAEGVFLGCAYTAPDLAALADSAKCEYTQAMWTPEELRRHIQAERARQALMDRPRVPDGVRIGSLTSLVMNGAAWRNTNAYPSAQEWADEAEKLFNFAVSQNQFGRFLPNLRGRWSQFESTQAELRVAFFLNRSGFRIAEWEPAGAAGCKGEFTVMGPSRLGIFTEIKSPGWEGELTSAELKAGRQREPKHVYCEGRAVGPWERVQFEVRKAYKKFATQKRNLLILADDLFIGLRHNSEMWASYALYSRRTGGCFADGSYENLGGVGFFSVTSNTDPISYGMQVFINPYALASVALPEDIRVAFQSEAEMQQPRLRMRTV
jgi:hypothetical protein